MYITETNLKHVYEHAEKREDGVWVCKKTGAEIQSKIIGRSIWIRPMMGGFGEVRPVAHPYCPECEPEIRFPEYGTPIYENELVEIQ